MTRITATLPDDLVRKIDRVAVRLNSSRAKLVEQAVECYLDDVEDYQLALDRLNDPTDAVLDWQDVRRELVDLPLPRSRVAPRKL